jgi:hypothetical protein
MIDAGVANFLLVMVTMVLVAGAGYGMIILLNALQRRIAGDHAGGPAELESLRQRVEELEGLVADGQDIDLAGRLADMEGRLEFAERLLAAGDPADLPEPSDEVTATGPGGSHG